MIRNLLALAPLLLLACTAPGVVPRVQAVWAIPNESVRTEAAATEPLPTATVKSTTMPETPSPSAAVTVTTIGRESGVTTGPV